MTRDPLDTLADDVAAGADGVDIVVTGSSVFDGRAPAENARHMLRALGMG